jgi:hypothetical protein
MRKRILEKFEGSEGLLVDLSDICDATGSACFKDPTHTFQEAKPAVAHAMAESLVQRIDFSAPAIIDLSKRR